MRTSFSKDLTGAAIREKIHRFYDFGSPLYLEAFGKHIHDGYYITGKETKEQAQENLIKLLAEKAGIEKGAKILDVGCGMGGSSIWLAKNLQAETTGITISPIQVEIANKMAREQRVNSSFLLMNAENMQFTENFQVIWAVASMTHFRDQTKFVKSAGKLLNEHGKFIMFDWMLGDDTSDVMTDPYIKPVAEGMLLSSLYSMNTYLGWFSQMGYRIIYAEDVTNRTIKTWDVALSVIKKPSVLKLALKMSKADLKEAYHFLNSIGAMKLAMQKHKIIGGIVIAEKL